MQNLLRMRIKLGSNLPVLTFDFLSDIYVHKIPIGEAVKIGSEHTRLLVLFAIKKCGSCPKTLKLWYRDMPVWLSYKLRLFGNFSSRVIEEFGWKKYFTVAIFPVNIFLSFYSSQCRVFVRPYVSIVLRYKQMLCKHTHYWFYLMLKHLLRFT